MSLSSLALQDVNTAAHYAALDGDLDELKYLQTCDVNLNVNTENGFTSAHFAAMKGHVDVLKYLQTCDVNLNATSENGSTAAHCAAGEGHVDVLKYLQACGVNLNAKTKNGSTATHFAGMIGHVDVLKYLHTCGVNLNAKDKNGFTAAHCAAMKGRLDVLKYLQTCDANLNAKSESGTTAAHFAADVGHVDVLKYLQTCDVNLNAKNKDGNTAAHCAAEGGHVDVLKYLQTCDINLNASNENDDTAAHVAAQEGHLDVLKYLQTCDINLNASNKNGFTAAHFAAMKGHVDVLKYLQTCDVNLNAKSESGSTAAHCAAKKGHVDVLKYLQTCGVNLNAKTKKLGEIIMKYQDSHLILIGGDFNEDLVDQKQSRRTKTLDNFMSENSLTTMYTEKTFIGSDGVDTSTIDYILFKTTMAKSVLSIARVENIHTNIHTNVSDHYPVRCRLRYSVEHAAPKKIETMSSSRVKWDKLDQDYYVALVNDGLEKVNASQASLSALDNEIVKLNDILSNSAKRATPSTVKRPTKAKLNVWSADIRMAISEKKAAFSMWKKSGMQTDKADTTVINKKETTKKLRQVCRLERAKDKQQERQEILDAKSYDMSLFHKLINRQRGKLKCCINELNVKDHI